METPMTFLQFFGYWVVCRILWALMMLLLQSTLASLLPKPPDEPAKK